MSRNRFADGRWKTETLYSTISGIITYSSAALFFLARHFPVFSPIFSCDAKSLSFATSLFLQHTGNDKVKQYPQNFWKIQSLWGPRACRPSDRRSTWCAPIELSLLCLVWLALTTATCPHLASLLVCLVLSCLSPFVKLSCCMLKCYDQRWRYHRACCLSSLLLLRVAFIPPTIISVPIASR